MRKPPFVLTFVAALLLVCSAATFGQAAPVAAKTNTRSRAPAPEPSPSPQPAATETETLKIDTNLVTIPVSCHGSDWSLSAGCTAGRTDASSKTAVDAEDRLLSESQRAVSRGPDARHQCQYGREAESRFNLRRSRFVEQLQPADRVKIISFDDQVRELNEFTNDRVY